MKKIDIKEFKEKGYLQEINRLFLHPLGLALTIKVDCSHTIWELDGILDCRDHETGFLFQHDLDQNKIENVEKLRLSKLNERIKTERCNKEGIQIK